MLSVPLGRALHTRVQVYLWLEAKFGLYTTGVINAAVGEKLYAATGERSAFTRKAGDDSKDVRGQISKPEWNAAPRQFFAKSISDGCGELVNGNWGTSGDIVAVPNGLWLVSTEEKGLSHVIDIDGVLKGPTTIDDAEETF